MLFSPKMERKHSKNLEQSAVFKIIMQPVIKR